MRDLVTDVSMALEELDEEKLARERVQWRKTARSFLTARRSEKVDDSDKAPRKYRQKALQWLIATNNMLEVSIGKNYNNFRLDSDPTQRPHPSLWPVLTVCIDQGSDGWGAV